MTSQEKAGILKIASEVTDIKGGENKTSNPRASRFAGAIYSWGGGG